MTSDNIVADFIQRNLSTIPFINYRDIDLTNSIFVDKVSSGDDIGIKYIQSVINLRNDGLDKIVSNNGFHHRYGVCWYYTTDDCVYSYNIFLLLPMMLFRIPCDDKSLDKKYRGVLFCLTLYFSPLVDYFSPLYYKQFNKNNININYYTFRQIFWYCRMLLSICGGVLMLMFMQLMWERYDVKI